MGSQVVFHRYQGGWNTDTSMNFHTDAHTGMEFNTDTDTDTMI